MKLILWVAVCSYAIALSYAKDTFYNGFKMYEVSMMDRHAGRALDYSMLENNNSYYEVYSRNGASAHILVHPDAQADILKLLNTNTMNYKIVHNDVGLWLQRDFEMNQKLRNLYPYQGKLGTERYYSHDEINKFIEDLAKQNPTRVEVKTVGKSFEGRWLKTIRITNGDGRANKNVILVDGGFHAREWISPAAVVYGINELVNNYEAHAQLLQDYDWVILPVVNPDGYEYSQISPNTRMWRKTRQPSSRHCIGIDPNRNFDFHWNEAGASSDPCDDGYAGPKAFSEPETIVVRDLIHSLADRGKMYLTVHSEGSYLLYPWGYIESLPDTWQDLDEVARAGRDAIKAATGNVYKVGGSAILMYPAAGASDDYAFNAGFPISFTMELPSGRKNPFHPPPTDIDRLVKETWVGIVAMAQKVVKKYPLN